MATEIQTQIAREAPDIEAAKIGLMESAKSQIDAINQAALEGRYMTPDYKIAGMSQDQLDAIGLGQAGINAYQPYLSGARTGLLQGVGTTGQALDVMRGADTREQFGAAQGAMQRAGIPLEQMTGAATMAMQGLPALARGESGLTSAQDMANRYAQANMGQSLGALGRGEQAIAGAGQMYDPSMAQGFMNPYQQQVIDEAMRQINRQGAISQQQLQGQATQAGAFGGSREGVMRAELGRGLADQRNAAIVNALQQGYQSAQQQAQNAFESQQQRALQQGAGLGSLGSTYGQQALQQAQLGQGAAGLTGSLAGQQAGLASLYGQLGGQQANILGQQAQLGQQQGLGIGNLAAQQFGIGSQMAQGLGALGAQQAAMGMNAAQLGQLAQGLGQQDVNFLYNLGAQQQRQQQSELDAARQNTLQQNMQPLQMLGFLSDIYRGAPSTQMSMTQQSQAAPSPFQQIAGLAVGALGTGAALQKTGAI